MLKWLAKISRFCYNINKSVVLFDAANFYLLLEVLFKTDCVFDFRGDGSIAFSKAKICYNFPLIVSYFTKKLDHVWN
jgi:hypothetical protein